MHTGKALSAGTGYVGIDVHRAARISAVADGGQILLSERTQALVKDDLPEGITLRDLGEHRLRDLTAPQRLFQIVAGGLPSEFPPLRSLSTISNNLPLQLTSFVGRQQEMVEVRRHLASTRLLTLTGAGGAGKTRLATEVAVDVLEEYKDGLWLVDLAPLADPVLVPQTVAAILNVREQPGRPIQGTLIEHLRDRQVLLVLDNCEHLLTACARLTDALLHTCPHLRVLATSREGLGIAGELTYRVPSLQVPDSRRLASLETLEQQEAVRLFVERAGFAVPGFKLTPQNAPAVVQVCERLDGMPLAIELAAGRVKSMSMEQLAARLDDRFRLLTGGSRTVLPRHQTLRAAMDWSYDLLSEPERIVLRRLSVFVGGWSLEAAEAVCAGNGIASSDVLDLLARLVDRSLVTMEASDGQTRYRMLETVRQYSREKLLGSNEIIPLRGRHRDHYLELAELAEPYLRGPEQASWLQRLESEHYNFRAALEWSKAAEDSRTKGLRLAGALWRFWNVRAYWSEGREWLAGLLGEATDAPPAIRAKALFGVGVLTWAQDLAAAAAASLEESLVLWRALEDKRGVADALRLLAQVAWDQFDYERAKTLGEESLVLFEELQDDVGTSTALRFLGFQALSYCELQRAQVFLDRSLSLARVLGDQRGIAWSLHGLGRVAFYKADFSKAVELVEGALSIFRRVGDRWGSGNSLAILGSIARARGDYEHAVQLHEQSLHLRQELTQKASIAHSLRSLGYVAQDQGDFERARGLHEESLALFRDVAGKWGPPSSTDSAPPVGESLAALGALACYQGDYKRALSLLEESLRIFRQSGHRWSAASSIDKIGVVARHQGDHARATELHREALRIRQELGDRLGAIESLEGLAAVAVATGRREQAARLFGAAEALREVIGGRLPPADGTDYDRAVSAVKEGLDTRVFARAWAEGRAMTLDQAVGYALSEPV